MRKLLFVPAMAAMAWGCSESTSPSVATTIAIAPASLTLDAVGARQVVHAAVANQRGKLMPDALLTWSSSSAAVTVVGAGGDSAFVTSAGSGAATVTATSGSATGTLAVQVTQVAAAAAREAGDGQTALAGAQLANQIRVRVRDRLDAPVAGQTVNFAITSGGGSVTPASAVTGADGTAAATWTLGPTNGANTLTVSFPGSSLAPLVYSATAGQPPKPEVLTVVSGGYQAGMEGTVIPASTVALVDGAGNPRSGVTVNFTVTGGGGTIATPSAVTNANGLATLSGWRIGTSGTLNTATATAVGSNATPVVLRAVECTGGGGAGYAITLCITTPMTAAQRGAFQSAAARWATIVKADLPDVTGAFAEGTCGSSPATDFLYDDLLIFAAVETIDGPGQILGQAGPCYVRSNRGLPVAGTMAFDVADLNTLETSGQLGNVILHEMGHVLGIGSRWNFYGLTQNLSTGSSVLDTYYNGPNGLAGFDAIGGTTYTGGQKVPVENTGGAGTANSHWRETVLRNELMTGYLNGGVPNPLSVLTVRSLTDMGYTVDPAAADPFSLTLSVRAPATEATPLKMENDVYTGPLFTVTPRGSIARVR